MEVFKLFHIKTKFTNQEIIEKNILYLIYLCFLNIIIGRLLFVDINFNEPHLLLFGDFDIIYSHRLYFSVVSNKCISLQFIIDVKLLT